MPYYGIIACLMIACALLSACVHPPVIVSDLTPQAAIRAHQPPDVPPDVLDRLTVVDVQYYDFHGVLRQGQIVIHKALAQDIRRIFAVIRDSRFPVESALPVAHPARLAKYPPYGMAPDNNSSGYCWRSVTSGNKASYHALGLALDINPDLNPYIKGDLVIPTGATYDPARPGTLTPDSPVVRTLKSLGWVWGGDWGDTPRIDYMHFEKVPPEDAAWVRRYRPD